MAKQVDVRKGRAGCYMGRANI